MNWSGALMVGLAGGGLGWAGQPLLERWIGGLRCQAPWLGQSGVWVTSWRQRQPWFLPLVGALLSFSALVAPVSLPARWALLGFEWGLLVLVLVDLEVQLLPDVMTLSLLLGGVGVAGCGWGWVSFTESLAGVLLGYGLLAGVGWGFHRLTGREGLGGGDLKLLAALGAWLGISAIPGVLFWGAALGVLAGLLLQHRGAQAYPFGPFLALGGMIMVWWNFLGRGQ